MHGATVQSARFGFARVEPGRTGNQLQLAHRKALAIHPTAAAESLLGIQVETTPSPMKTHPPHIPSVAVAVGLSLMAAPGLLSQDLPDRPSDAAHGDSEGKAAPSLVAVLSPTEGNEARGIVTFEALGGDQVRVTARVSGLNPDAKHAIHVHEFGDISSPDGARAGSHFNPHGTAHGLPGSGEKHPGDFGNLQADAEGNANLVLTVRDLSLVGGEEAILGRAVIVHADEAGHPSSAGDQPGVRSAKPSPGAELGQAAEEIGRGAERAVRGTARAVERGAEEVGDALKKVGKKIEGVVD